MGAEEEIDLSDCAREPIHIPGAIQSHGVLLVVDDDSDAVLQAGGDTGSLLGFPAAVVGRSLRDVLGISLEELLLRTEATLGRRPVSLGRISIGPDSREVVALAHQAPEGTIVELQAAGPRVMADRVLAQLRAASDRLNTASDLLGSCKVAIQEIRKAIGYDRAMIYQFLDDASGAVIAEDREDYMPVFLNHRYPATDIPAQARALYKDNPIRVIPDVEYVPSPVLPELSPVTGAPLDMSHCLLRSVSPVHIRYLKNMDVSASMSVSLLVHGELWGLISCQNTSPKAVPYEALEICSHLGHLLSNEIRVRQEVERAEVARELHQARENALSALDGTQDPGRLLSPDADLQAMVRSHGMAVVTGDRVAVIGHAPTETQARQLARWLEQRGCGPEGFATDCLSEVYPEALSFASVASGMLGIVFPCDSPIVLMWFRAEQVEEINWAGNPHKPAEPGEEAGQLNPRSSFATWTEIVRNRSRAWEPIDLQSAQEFATRALSTLRRHQIDGLNQDLERLASLDALTEIPNRRSFDERLRSEMARARRKDGDLALLLLDLDFFKEYNDFYGHGAGDECLKQVADALQAGIRAGDLAARIGGEEFAIVLADGSFEGASRAAELIRARIEALGLPHAKSPVGVVTASVGIAVARADTLNSVDTLLASADKALYQAKRGGRNMVCGSTDVGHPEARG